jgi:hypothetical protein
MMRNHPTTAAIKKGLAPPAGRGCVDDVRGQARVYTWNWRT